MSCQHAQHRLHYLPRQDCHITTEHYPQDGRFIDINSEHFRLRKVLRHLEAIQPWKYSPAHPPARLETARQLKRPESSEYEHRDLSQTPHPNCSSMRYAKNGGTVATEALSKRCHHAPRFTDHYSHGHNRGGETSITLIRTW